MERLKRAFEKLKAKTIDAQAKGASAHMAEELFYDLYNDRKRIYKVNFVRGIFFGVGSALGGTLVLALVVWILSLFVNFPVIGDAFEDAQHSIEQRSENMQPLQ